MAVLQQASSLQLAGMTLAGYSSQDGVWKAMCGSLIEQLQHPYLHCCFS